MSMKSSATVAIAAEHQRESWANSERGNASWVTLFSSDKTPTSSMSAGVMEIPGNGGVLKRHSHPQAEIYFVHEGMGVLTVNDVTTTITAGTAAFIPGDAAHSLRNDSSTALKIFYVFPTDCFADVAYRFPD